MDHGLRIGEEIGLRLVRPRAQQRQNPAPDPRTDDRYDAKGGESHPNDPGRDRDQMAHHRKQPGEKDTTGLIPDQPLLCLVELGGR